MANELGHVLRRDLPVDDEHIARVAYVSHAGEVLDRVVGQLGVERPVDRVARSGKHQRGAVGRSLGHQ